MPVNGDYGMHLTLSRQINVVIQSVLRIKLPILYSALPRILSFTDPVSEYELRLRISTSRCFN